MAKCKNCGKKFIKLGGERFCSTSCAFEYEEKHKDEIPEELREQECTWCKETFFPRYKGQKCCCADCSEDYRDAMRDVKLVYKKSVSQALDFAKDHPEETNREICRRFNIL